MKRLEKEDLQFTLSKIKRHQNGQRICFTTHDIATLETAISRVTNRLSEKEWNAVIFAAIHLEHEEDEKGVRIYEDEGQVLRELAEQEE